MDALALQYEDQAALDALPTDVQGLFTKGDDGKFNLTGVSGMKTQTDINNIQEGLRKERHDHATTKASLGVWGDLKHADVVGQLDKIAEYKLAADGKMDDEKINSLVESRLGQKTGPLDRQITTLTGERDTAVTALDVLKKSVERRDMNDAVRTVATEMKVHGTAVVDVELVAASFLELDETTGEFIVKADAKGITPGIDIKGFMKEMQKLRPHWWPTSSGGGAGGGGNEFGGQGNPWAHDTWNLTKQGSVVRDQGSEVAASMAKAAGTSVGGLKPPKK